MPSNHKSKTCNKWSFVRNIRNNRCLYYFGYVFRCDKFKKNKKTASMGWRCLTHKKTGCKSRLIFLGNKLIKETPHNHESDYQLRAHSLVEYKSLEDDDIEDWLKKSDD